jgi:hypothetical protein
MVAPSRRGARRKVSDVFPVDLSTRIVVLHFTSSSPHPKGAAGTWGRRTYSVPIVSQCRIEGRRYPTDSVESR